MSKSQKVTLCVVLLIVLLIAWGLFPLFFKWLMIGIGSKETALKDFGTFGDIYGSLNTLFTSATLIIVMYSAYLQRQANKDARDAMERQLQQAKEDTEEQLKQAREATEQQILNAQQLADIQLKHARQYSMDQLALAKATHDAQIKESKDAIFTNKFYSLLNYKKDKLNSLSLRRNINIEGENSYEDVTALQAIEELGNNFHNFLESDASENFINLTHEQLIQHYYQCGTDLGYQTIAPLISYCCIYTDLCYLIQCTSLSEQDKIFYSSVLSNSMYQYEQVFLFWVTPIFNIINLHDNDIFTMIGHMKPYEPYVKKFYSASNFKFDEWKSVFE
ncbi:hypothetical protein [Acinetobacter soli]|uniref:hypothetical protein n=1 Tax=Acinetobacter soli TaxID=487316 RepID=UPI002FF36153